MISSREQSKQCNGRVFNIQRFSVNDGPGIRTIVFLKGCPLRCNWCSNPESQVMDFQLMYNEKNCDGCLRCKDICSNEAISFENNKAKINRGKCNDCGKCAEKCYKEALVYTGKWMTVEQVINEVKKDSSQFPYHKMGLNKYDCLGRDYELDEDLIDDEALEEFKKIVENNGIKCNIGAI